MTLVVGLISGTSMDGVDAALVRVGGDTPEVVAHQTYPYPEGLRVGLRRCQREGRLEAVARLNFLVGEVFADAANDLLGSAGVAATDVDCVASHGQTLVHLPEPSAEFGPPVGATLQIGEGAVIAARTGIVTVCDFRVADMALGGQGAPLVPWLDWQVFRSRTEHRILLNLGGVANVTSLPAGCELEDVVAFDTGPANVLIDAVARARGLPGGIDAGGAVAATGAPQAALLEALLADPYYDAEPPKSADAAHFERMLPAADDLATEDLLATVTELTATTVAAAVRRWISAPTARLLVSGGGVHNDTLMGGLRDRLGGLAVESLAARSAIPVDAKEAVAFALMGLETLSRRPSNVPGATGASGPAVLGKVVYPPPL